MIIPFPIYGKSYNDSTTTNQLGIDDDIPQKNGKII